MLLAARAVALPLLLPGESTEKRLGRIEREERDALYESLPPGNEKEGGGLPIIEDFGTRRI